MPSLQNTLKKTYFTCFTCNPSEKSADSDQNLISSDDFWRWPGYMLNLRSFLSCILKIMPGNISGRDGQPENIMTLAPKSKGIISQIDSWNTQNGPNQCLQCHVGVWPPSMHFTCLSWISAFSLRKLMNVKTITMNTHHYQKGSYGRSLCEHMPEQAKTGLKLDWCDYIPVQFWHVYWVSSILSHRHVVTHPHTPISRH